MWERCRRFQWVDWRLSLVCESAQSAWSAGGWFWQTLFLTWRSRFPCWAKASPQWLHVNGLLPMCIRMWSRTLQSFLNSLLQYVHLSTWFRRPVSAFRRCNFTNPLSASACSGIVSASIYSETSSSSENYFFSVLGLAFADSGNSCWKAIFFLVSESEAPSAFGRMLDAVWFVPMLSPR